MTTSVFIRHIRVDPWSLPAHQTGSRGGAERRSAGLARSAPRALRQATPRRRRQGTACRAPTPVARNGRFVQHGRPRLFQTKLINIIRDHPCSSVVSVSIRVLFLAHVTRHARVPPPVTGFRTPYLPLLPLWEKGVGGMRGHRRLPLRPVWEKGKGRRRPPAAPPRNGCVTLVA